MFWTRSGPAVVGMILLGAAIGAVLLLLMSVFMSDRGEGGPAMAFLMAVIGLVYGGLYGLVPAALCAALLLTDLRGRRSPSFRIAVGTLGAAVGAAIPELVFFARALFPFADAWVYFPRYIAIGVVMAAISAVVAAPLLAWGERRSSRAVAHAVA
ncbi:hypothetical protein JNB62_07540 [Microbacterium jejuense]|uniref:Uncharacterized protein n=1 Tax=Microbacterium jejuense TaxID=1263637 RepID=A0ABS7HLB5_9MICO|nr:hypothetical protein [Microbacterium jejuense]MBW9093530.1 hypothetical protein [Microbacterium jejuense]